MAMSVPPPSVRVRAPTGPRATTDSPAPSEFEALPAFPPDQPQPTFVTSERTPSPGPIPIPMTVQKQNHKKQSAATGDSEADQKAATTPVTPRRSSFSFLKRGKSVERLNSTRSASGKKLTKKQQRDRDLQAEREAAMLPKEAPKLPAPEQSAPLQTFGGEGAPERRLKGTAQQQQQHGYRAHASAENMNRPPLPPMPGSHKGAFVDPYARSESMTNRGRYSYASSTASTLNSPRRIRRRKDPTPFNVLVVGAKNSGKTAFINFLRTSLALPARKQPARRDDFAPELNQKASSAAFKYHFLETELSDGERVGLTIWDSEGFEKNVIDLQLREVAAFLESKFEETLNEELKVVRSPGARDTHIHAVFLLLDPVHLEAKHSAAQKAREAQRDGQSSRGHPVAKTALSHDEILGSLDSETDLQILRTLQGKTTVIPVISKADTIPQDYMVELKRSVGESLRQASLDPLENLALSDDEEDSDEEEAERRRAMHRRHDSKKFDERDEDRLLPSEQAIEEDDRSNLSVLDLTSSSSSTSITQDNGRKAGKTDMKSSTDGNLFLPLSVISPYPIVDHEPGTGRVGRKFAWGFADPYEPEHCDFVRLKEAVFREWRDELREASRELWYERWRTLRLNHTGDRTSKVHSSQGASAGHASRNGARIQNVQPSSANTRTTQWPLA